MMKFINVLFIFIFLSIYYSFLIFQYVYFVERR